jgi:hypothetical protein
MPELVELHQKVEGRGIRVVAVSIDLPDPGKVKTAEELGAFLERRDLALPVVAFQGDLGSLTRRLKLPEGPPCTLLFDREAREVGRIEGPAQGQELQDLITKALAR